MMDCKVLAGESVAKQHRTVVCKVEMKEKQRKMPKTPAKTRWWKLKENTFRDAFRNKVEEILGKEFPVDWNTVAESVRCVAKEVLGVSTGRKVVDKETWWWSEDVQLHIQRKRDAKKTWDKTGDAQKKMEYKEACRQAKRAVAKAKSKAYQQLYAALDHKDGEKVALRLARQRDKASKDVQHVRIIKDGNGKILTNEEDIKKRWKDYYEKLMNHENEREKRTDTPAVHARSVSKVSREEVQRAMNRMKTGKAVGLDDIPIEAWRSLGEPAVNFLTSLFNALLESEEIPKEWRKSILVPIFKNKGDAQDCTNYRGIKLMSHTMKIWERVIEERLRKEAVIGEQQYGFMPGKSTMDAIFALRMLAEKYREGQKELHCIFLDLEKAYDTVPREEVWYCLRQAGISEKYVNVIQDMYEGCETAVRCAVGVTDAFKVEVGLHQGSALSPFLFVMIMDRLTEEVRKKPPWTMLFADDVVLTSGCKRKGEQDLEQWRHALERRGLKISRTKSEYMCVNKERETSPLQLQGTEVPETKGFKYLGSTLEEDGGYELEIKKRIQAGWFSWQRMRGILCDRKAPVKVKGKLHKMVVRPGMIYGLETVALTARQEAKMDVEEMKMLRRELGVTRKDRVRNVNIRGALEVGRFSLKVREARLRWYGHVLRREEEYVGRRMLEFELPGRRRRGRPRRRYLDVVKSDMEAVGVSVQDAQDRTVWRRSIRCGDP